MEVKSGRPESQDHSREPVEKLAESFFERRRRGEKPTLEEYIEKHPELADEIREVFPALLLMEDAARAGPGASSAGSAAGAAGEGEAPQRIGEYRILREVGRGGMGIVYEAEQESLGRRVALKVLPFHSLLDQRRIERFRREARAAAKLHHPNIVPIHGVGEDRGIHFYAMQFVDGQGLDQVIVELKKLKGSRPDDNTTSSVLLRDPSGRVSSSGGDSVYFHNAARIALQAAGALAYAHAEGILHRDIKPSNLLLDSQGTVWVTDFGLAKAEGSSELTLTGDLLGTLRYMAPERFQGWSDPRSDVYGLGLTLYELLALRPAFEDSDRTRLLRKVTEAEPPAPRKLDRRIPLDLETIVLKAAAKEPGHRYASAAAMAEDLRRYLSGEPIRARSVSRLERTWRWCRRKPSLAVLTASVALLFLVIALGSSLLTLSLRERLWEAYLARAQAGRWSRRAGQRFGSLEAIAQAARIRPSAVLRNEAIASLALADVRTVRPSTPAGHAILCAFDLDLERYALGEEGGRVRIHRTADDQELLVLEGAGNSPGALCFSPDGRHLAAHCTGGGEDLFAVWNLARREVVLKVRAVTPAGLQANGFDFSPDGRLAAIGTGECDVALYDLISLERVKSFPLRSPANSIRFGPDRMRLAVVTLDPSLPVLILDEETGKTVRGFSHPERVYASAWSPDGAVLAVVSNSGAVYLWDVGRGERRAVLEGHQGAAVGAFFNHAGDLLASVSWDGTTRFWDPRTGEHLLRVQGGGLGFSKDDARLGFALENCLPGIWEAARSGECVVLHLAAAEPVAGPSSASWSADGRLLALAMSDGVRLWDASRFREVAVLPPAGSTGVAFLPDGKGLLCTGTYGMDLWEIEDHDGDWGGSLRAGPPRALARGLSVSQVSLSRDGRKAAVAASSGGWIFALGPEVSRIPLGGHHGLSSIGLSPDGRWAATGAYHGSGVKVWDAATGREEREVQAPGRTRVAFSPGGRWLVIASLREYRFLEVGSWEEKRSLRCELGCVLAFGGDEVLAIARSPEVVELVEASTGGSLARFESPSSRLLQEILLSPDGSQLLVSGGGGTVRLWDLRLVRERLAAMGLDWDRPPLAARSAPDAPVRIEVRAGESPPAGEDAGKARTDHLRRLLNDLGRRIALDPGEAELFHQRSHIHQELGRPDLAGADEHEALRRYARDIERMARSAEPYRRRAAFFLCRMQHREAIQDLERALELDPDSSETLNTIAWTKATGPQEVRDPAGALPLALRAVETASELYPPLNTLGVVYCRLGRFEEAVEAFERAGKASSTGPTAFDLFFLAMAQAQLGKRELARSLYQEALRFWERNPHLPPGHARELEGFKAEAEALLKSGEER